MEVDINLHAHFNDMRRNVTDQPARVKLLWASIEIKSWRGVEAGSENVTILSIKP